MAQSPKQTELRARPTTFIVFPYDKKCSCINTDSDSATVSVKEVRENGKVFQSFTELVTHREIFRTAVGSLVNGEEIKFWNYGLAEERDFNGDRKPDYAWYGGDDTSFEKLLILSAPRGYQKVDVIATVKKRWAKEFPGKPLADLHLLSSNQYLTDEVLTQTPRGVALGVTINSDLDNGAKRRLLIVASEFVIQK